MGHVWAPTRNVFFAGLVHRASRIANAVSDERGIVKIPCREDLFWTKPGRGRGRQMVEYTKRDLTCVRSHVRALLGVVVSTWGPGWSRTAKSMWNNPNKLNKPHLNQLVHGVVPYRTEWASICGYAFLSYETTWEPRQVTCVWCLTGIVRENLKGP